MPQTVLVASKNEYIRKQQKYAFYTYFPPAFYGTSTDKYNLELASPMAVVGLVALRPAVLLSAKELMFLFHVFWLVGMPCARSEDWDPAIGVRVGEASHPGPGASAAAKRVREERKVLFALVNEMKAMKQAVSQFMGKCTRPEWCSGSSGSPEEEKEAQVPPVGACAFGNQRLACCGCERAC